MTNYEPSDGVRRIRDQLDHPIIDSDGHLIEFLPLVGTWWSILPASRWRNASTPSCRAVRRSRE
jgi:hypothetical protein